MSTLIIPVAGQSSRFGTQRPKWLLTMPNGKLMLEEAISKIAPTSFDRVLLVALEEHIERHTSASVLCGILKDGMTCPVEVLQLKDRTRSQAETIARAITDAGVIDNFFVKDCDNSFTFNYSGGNIVCTIDLHEAGTLNAANKSYVQVDPLGVVKNIIEKRVISNYFCCGGYGFASPDEYLSHYESLKDHENLYLSHVIFSMISAGTSFQAKAASQYHDWGTEEDYRQYCDGFRTIFCDLDGVLFKNSSKFSTSGWTYEPIIENVQAIKKLSNTRLIISTSRPETCKDAIVEKLNQLGLFPTEVITGLPHAKRFLINDFSASNPYPTAISINIQRDSNTLTDLLPRG